MMKTKEIRILSLFISVLPSVVVGLDSGLVPVIGIAVGVGVPLLVVLIAIIVLAVYLKNLHNEKQRMMGSVNNSKVEIPPSASSPVREGSLSTPERSRPMSTRINAKK